jgi:hypothetical protein
MNIDRNPAATTAVPRTMGHASTKTTETHYGRIRNSSALDELHGLWETAKPSPEPKAKNEMIEKIEEGGITPTKVCGKLDFLHGEYHEIR